MKRIVLKLYALAVVVVAVILAGLYMQYAFARNMMQEEAQQHILLSSAVLQGEIMAWMVRNNQLVDDAGDFIAARPWHSDDILIYLKMLRHANPRFASLYYGTAENTMINASGWKMPAGFDLRIRPWYVQAAGQDRLIYTHAFVNASKDDVIITIARPVHGADNSLLGVVGGDVSLRTMIDMVQEKKIGESGFSFLVDGNGVMVAHPGYHLDIEVPLPRVTEEYAAVISAAKGRNAEVFPASFRGRDGYVIVRIFPNTDWVLCSFVPLEDFLQTREHLMRTFVLALTVALVILAFFVFYLMKYVFRPVALLHGRVEQIDVEQRDGYRISEAGLADFSVLARSANKILDKAQAYMNQLEENELELRRSEERMRAGEARYRALIADSFEAIALIDLETREIVEINHRFVEMFGYQIPQDSPLFVDDCVIDDPAEIEDLYNRKLREKRIWQPEARTMRRRNGARIMVERAGSVIRIEGRDYFMSTMRDITEEKRRQTELQQEVDLACRVQHELLPQLAPSPLIDLRILYYPAYFVSGDTFHLEWRDSGTVLRGFLVDVSGHGLAVAVQTAAVKVLLQEASTLHLSLMAELHWLNKRISQYFAKDAYAAMLAFEIDFFGQTMRYVGAGITHFYAQGKRIASPGMFVGLWETAEFEEGVIPALPGDAFYFLTDGFTDHMAQMSRTGELFPDGQGFGAKVAKLAELGDIGGLRDDAAGICLKINERQA